MTTNGPADMPNRHLFRAKAQLFTCRFAPGTTRAATNWGSPLPTSGRKGMTDSNVSANLASGILGGSIPPRPTLGVYEGERQPSTVFDGVVTGCRGSNPRSYLAPETGRITSAEGQCRIVGVFSPLSGIELVSPTGSVIVPRFRPRGHSLDISDWLA